jgi:serine/threonine protein kinase
VIYELIAGRTPFEGETSTDVIVAITQKEPPPLARFAPDVPAELEWIVMKALRKDRDERYQTIKELITDFERLKQRLEFESELERSAVRSASRSRRSVIPRRADDAANAQCRREKDDQSRFERGVHRARNQASQDRGRLSRSSRRASASAFYLYNATRTAHERDTVLLTDFRQHHGRTGFRRHAETGPRGRTRQTPFLNSVSRGSRARNTAFMGRSPDDRITRDVGREICERQGIKAMLTARS